MCGDPPLTNQQMMLLLLTCNTLQHQLLVHHGIILVVKDTCELERLSCPLALKHQGGHEMLNLGRTADFLRLLGGEGT